MPSTFIAPTDYLKFLKLFTKYFYRLLIRRMITFLFIDKLHCMEKTSTVNQIIMTIVLPGLGWVIALYPDKHFFNIHC